MILCHESYGRKHELMKGNMIEVGVKIYGLRLIEKVNGARKQQEKCLKKRRMISSANSFLTDVHETNTSVYLKSI